MTTILAHRDALYADSLCTEDDIPFRSPKILSGDGTHGPFIVGYCGETRMFNAFYKQISILGRGYKELLPIAGHDARECTDFSALLIDKYGIWYFNQYFAGAQVDGLYAATGSGAFAALGAVEVQKITATLPIDPVRAVMAATKVDINSAGPVQWMKLAEGVLHKESV